MQPTGLFQIPALHFGQSEVRCRALPGITALKIIWHSAAYRNGAAVLGELDSQNRVFTRSIHN